LHPSQNAARKSCRKAELHAAMLGIATYLRQCADPIAAKAG
jgi:hypothetical protein